MTPEEILDLLDDPEALEARYRRAPEAFRRSLEEAVRARPGSSVLRVWRARLDDRKPTDGGASVRLAWAIAIALGCGTLVRLPAVWLGEEWYYPRLAPSWALLAVAAYFWTADRGRRRLAAGLALAVVAAAYTALLPDYTDSVVMALIHLPVLFWAFLGIVFTGTEWRQPEARIRFIRYNGELLVLGSLVALGGLVFSGLTVALFGLISEGVDELYAENVGVFGAAAVPLAGTYLYDAVFDRRTGIASALARVFAPLFLVMAGTYLIVAFLGGQNPFLDRSFLITFNGLLLVVLGMTVFSVAERGEGGVGWVDYVNVALVAVTLAIDAIALSAIVFRLGSYGFTPNRVVVLGANLVILTHLALVCRAYVRFLRSGAGMPAVRRVVAGYLPVYVGWAALVVFVLPFLFGFS